MLTLDNLTVSFHGRTILNGVTCSIAAGERVGIIGPNGSGKTTLFNCISGFTPCVTGSITLRGERIDPLPPHERARRGIGRVFQNFGIFREMTLLENMVVALESRPGSRRALTPWSSTARQLRANALERLHEIHLADRAQARASELSGGQMRLLELARTLAFGAELFLLDEPTAGVSPRMKDEIAEAITKLQTTGKTVLIIEHDLTFIERLCSRILVLNDGRIELDGPPEHIRSDARLQTIYFGQYGAAANRSVSATLPTDSDTLRL